MRGNRKGCGCRYDGYCYADSTKSLAWTRSIEHTLRMSGALLTLPISCTASYHQGERPVSLFGKAGYSFPPLFT